MNAARGTAGMTLLELVVALAVTGATLAAGYGALATVADRRALAEAEAAATMEAAAVRETLASWIAGASGTGGSRALITGLDGVRDGLADDELLLFTRASTPLEAPLTELRLRIDRDPETPAEGLVAELSTGRGDAPTVLTLVPTAVGLDVRYVSGVIGGRLWLPSWISSTVLPAGLELTLVGPAGDTLHPLLSLPLRVPLEAGR